MFLSKKSIGNNNVMKSLFNKNNNTCLKRHYTQFNFKNDFGFDSARWLISYPGGPYHFKDREYMIISYRTDPEKLQKILPAGIELLEPIVKFEFIKMPNSTGFGSYTESGQVIPIKFNGEEGTLTISMFLDDYAPIAGGREIWGFPKKLAKPKMFVEDDVMIGFLDYGSVRIATATMGYKQYELDKEAVLKSMKKPVFLLKNIPGVDGKPQINQLTKTYLTDITVKGAWTGLASLELHPHCMAPIADFPVREIVDVSHFILDLTLPYGEVAHDYLKDGPPMN